MAGRFPGARTVDELWTALRDGVCAVETLSTQELRSNGVASAELSNPRYVRAAATLAGYDAFDAERFGYSPREAKLLDPQHRIFLESCLTALEDAGVAPRDGKARIGVFAGAGGSLRSYATALALRGETASLAHVSTDKDFLATRVSFELGLTGPSLGVQTSTSSSLVAVHLACRSLLDGECDVALAGGAAVRFPHRVGYVFEEGGVLSADGVCRPLDAGANGTVFGNGVGVVVLKRLDDALADHDRIRAVVLGSAIGHDGGSKSSYVISSADGVARVAGEALARAGVGPETIGLVEAHATGTVVGDPIEFAGLTKAYRGSRGPTSAPTGIGSVKGNVGHLEAAAGITSLIKAVLALENELKPRTLGVTTPNPALGVEHGPFRVLKDSEPWPAGPTARRAAIPSLGLGGTNAAVILEEAPAAPPRTTPSVERPWHILTLSGPTETALARQAKRIAADLRSHPTRSFADVCYTANVGRIPLAHRLAVAAASPEAIADALEDETSWSTDNPPDSPALILRGGPAASAPMVAFLFSGQGQQRLGMTRELFETLPSFRASLSGCDALLRKRLGFSVLDIVFGADNAALQRPRNLQPIFFSVQYSLAKMLLDWGVTPSAAIGHSFGEYAAACTAGAFSLDDALDLVVARGRLTDRGPGETAMATVFATGERVQRAVAPYPRTVGIAAQNSNEEWVISGEATDVEAVAQELAADGIKVRKFDAGFAGHSPALEPILDELEATASRLTYCADLRFPVVSTLTGRLAGAGDLRTGRYWRDHTRQMVRAASAIHGLYELGANVFVEIGPSPTLLPATMAAAEERGLQGVVGLPLLSRKQTDWRRVLETLAALHVRGVDVDWKGFDRDFGRRLVSFPTYAFNRQTYNLVAEQNGDPARGRPVGSAASSTGALGRRIHSPALREHVYERDVHEVGLTIFDIQLASLRLFLEVALEATGGRGGLPGVLGDVSFLEPLTVGTETGHLLQTVIRPNAARPSLEVFSALSADDDWTLHCKASFSTNDPPPIVATAGIATVQASATEDREGASLYRFLDECGFLVAESERTVARIWSTSDAAVVEITSHIFALDPSARIAAAIDAAAHGLLAIVKWEEDRSWLPLGLQSLEVHSAPADSQGTWLATIEIRGVPTDGRTVTADITVCDRSGQRIASVAGFCLREVFRSALVAQGRELNEWSYGVAWEAQDVNVDGRLSLPPTLSRWIVVGDDPFAAAVAARINEHGGHALLVDDVAKVTALAVGRSNGVINLLPAALGPDDSLEVALAKACKSSVDLANTFVHAGAMAGTMSIPLLVVTRGGQPVLGSLMEPNQALAWGATRTLKADHPNLRCLNLDLDPHAADRGMAALLKTLAMTDGESQTAFRHDRRHVARLVRSSPSRRQLVPPGDVYRAALRSAGQIDNLVLTPVGRQPPLPHQVEIAAYAHGLSFRDVLTVLGVPGARGAIGFECAGVVTAVGATATRFKVGDTVVALSPTELATNVLVDERLVAHIAPSLSFEEAATIPLAFVVAWHLVHDVAAVKAGQSVLVHAASGAVGQAIVQLARAAGARVFATASLTKQRAVRNLRVESVFSSRTHEFGAEVLARTDGIGVDAVFHSLQPRFLPTSAQCLKPDGVVVDFSVGADVEIDPLSLDRKVVRFDLVDAIERIPGRLGETLRLVVDAIASGTIRPIASRTFAIHDLRTAFHRLISPKHTGKVVIATEVEPLSSIAPRGEAFDPLGTYFVCGGTVEGRDAFAMRLRQAGGGQVVRLGPTSASEPETSVGDDIRVDARSVDLVEAISTAFRRYPRIRGIFLLPNVGGDVAVGLGGWAGISATFLEAATFARAIDQATRALSLPLDFFFLFSSVASIIGIPGAAFESVLSSYLGGLAHSRRASGLPATAIDWGAPVGETSGGGAVAPHWARGRLGQLLPSRALAVMASMIDDPPTEVAILGIRWETVVRKEPSLRGQPFFSRLFLESADPRRRKTDIGRVAAELREAPVPERLPRLTEFVEASVVHALGLRSSQRIDPNLGFREMGLDSLLSVDLRNQLQEALDLRLPQGITFNHPNLTSLSDFLASKLFPAVVAPSPTFSKMPLPTVASAAAPTASDDDLDAMSDEELAALVRAETSGSSD